MPDEVAEHRAISLARTESFKRPLSPRRTPSRVRRADADCPRDDDADTDGPRGRSATPLAPDAHDPAALSARIAELEAQHYEMLDANARLQKRCSDQAKEMDRLRAEADAAEAQKAETLEQAALLERQLALARRDFAHLAADLDAERASAARDRDASDAARADAVKAIAELSMQLAALRNASTASPLPSPETGSDGPALTLSADGVATLGPRTPSPMPGAPSEEHVQALRKQLAEARATINMALRDSEEHRDKAEALADQLAHKSHEIKRLNAEIESLLMQVRTMQEQNEMLENALEAQNIQQPAPKSAVPDHEQDTMLDGATSVSRRPSKPPQRASSLKSLQRLMPAQSSSVSLALELAEMDTNAKLAQAVKKLQRENVSLVRSLVATLESVSRIK